MQSAPIEIDFLHPHTDKIFSAEIGPATNGQRCIDGLLNAGFLEPLGLALYYRLTRHDLRRIPLDARLVLLGVSSGDCLHVEVYDAALYRGGVVGAFTTARACPVRVVCSPRVDEG